MDIQAAIRTSRQELLDEDLVIKDENWDLTGHIKRLKKIRDVNLARRKFIKEQMTLHDFELSEAEL